MARHPELLIPASSLEVLKTAVIFGADAVYIGGEAFGLRAKAKNFSMEDMKEGIAFAHEHDVKVYVTANILAHNEDLPGVRKYFEELKEIKPDALIIADPGVFEIAKEVCPEIERHISTQANNTNYGTYNFWYKQGASRVVFRQRAVSGRNQRAAREYSGGSGNRDICTWSDVYFLFRKMPSEQLFHRQRCEQGGMYPPVPLEICGCGGEETGRVSAGL